MEIHRWMLFNTDLYKTQNPLAKSQIMSNHPHVLLNNSDIFPVISQQILILHHVTVLYGSFVFASVMYLMSFEQNHTPPPPKKQTPISKKKRVSSAYAPAREFHVTMFGLKNTFDVTRCAKKDGSEYRGKRCRFHQLGYV